MHIDDKARARYPGLKLAAYQIDGLKKTSSWIVNELKKEMEELEPILDAYKGFGCVSKIEKIASGTISQNPISACVELVGFGNSVVISAFDWDKIAEEPYLTLAEKGELSPDSIGGELVFRDQEKLLARVPCEDINAIPDKKTKNVLIVAFGSGQISRGQLIDALEDAARMVKSAFGGKTKSMMYLD